MFRFVSLRSGLHLALDLVYELVYNIIAKELFLMKNYEHILLKAIEENHFFTNEDLRMNRKYNILFESHELKEYLLFKDNYSCEKKVELPLVPFNSLKMYYFKTNELNTFLDEYLEFINNDLIEKESTIISDNYEDIIVSRMASELDGTLRIEGVNTTRRQMMDIYNNIKKTLDSNDIIIRNMIKGFEFIAKKPEFNKENLITLYNILSNDCLTEETKLDGKYYRLDRVYVGDHEGCPAEKIDGCMDSLYKYVNAEIHKRNFYLPFIAHYYMIYIHPYYDYNGRTARMVSLWVSLLSNMHDLLPTFISEAINDDKNNYYKAIDNSRFSHNDLTYFISYLLNLSNKYYLVYKNINVIKAELAFVGESLSPTESYYLKRIMINSKKGWFNYRGFIDFCKIDITKQGALKILNKLLNYELLVSRNNSKNEKIFMINEEKILYKF